MEEDKKILGKMAKDSLSKLIFSLSEGSTCSAVKLGK